MTTEYLTCTDMRNLNPNYVRDTAGSGNQRAQEYIKEVLMPLIMKNKVEQFLRQGPWSLTCTSRNYLPVMHRGHFSNQIGEAVFPPGKYGYQGKPVLGAKLWYSRMTNADGAACWAQEELELLVDGVWIQVVPRQ